MSLVKKRAKGAVPAKPGLVKKQEPIKTKKTAPVKKKVVNENVPARKPQTSLVNEGVKMEKIEKVGRKGESPRLIYKPRTVRYDLYVKDTMVAFSGKSRKAIAINGSIPAPTLTFTEGDTAEIYVHNKMSVETSLHWHGVFVPNRFDGVPHLTQMPIKPHST